MLDKVTEHSFGRGLFKEYQRSDLDQFFLIRLSKCNLSNERQTQVSKKHIQVWKILIKTLVYQYLISYKNLCNLLTFQNAKNIAKKK
jgi:hypothetical protein